MRVHLTHVAQFTRVQAHCQLKGQPIEPVEPCQVAMSFVEYS